MVKKLAKRLYRSESDRILAGVAGGIAEYFEVDPLLVRIVTALAILSGGGLILYILLWIFVPSRSSLSSTTEKTIEANAEELSRTAEKWGKEASRNGTWGVLLIVIGIYFLLQNFNLIPWRIWNELWKLWPIALILLGLRAVTRK